MADYFKRYIVTLASAMCIPAGSTAYTLLCYRQLWLRLPGRPEVGIDSSYALSVTSVASGPVGVNAGDVNACRRPLRIS